MQRVLKKIFLIDEKTENTLKFWVLLGPFFLLLSIILAPFELAVLATAALFLSYRFKFKGLFLSLIALTAFSLYTQVNLVENHLWNLGLEASIALSLIITAFGLDEIKNFISHKRENPQDLLNLQQQINENQKAFENTEKNYQVNINQLTNDLDTKAENLKLTYLENENLKKDLTENTQRKDYLLNELDQKVKETEDLQVKLDELYEKISFLKDEEFLLEKNKTSLKEIEELKNLSATLSQEKEKFVSELSEKDRKIQELEKNIQKVSQNLNSKENEKILLELNEKKQKIINLENKLTDLEKNKPNIDELHKKLKDTQIELKTLKQTKNHTPLTSENITDKELLKEYDNKNRELSKLNSLYVQLKDQFNEKQRVLHKTRQDLFHAQENFTALKKELNDDFKDLSDNEKSLMKDLDKTESELKVYKQENQNLQDLIGELLEKSSSKNEEKIFEEKEEIPEPEVTDQKELF
ncbi:MAG: hypothetical protein K1000chlam1_00471 [Candidatus Anoxychlamydiales bacterium]|nr:hypothetical protein [Candidatus Anoxychlamydiales bacterium]